MGDLHVHVGKVIKGSIKVGENVNLEINVLKDEIMLKHITQQLIYYTKL